MDMVRRIAEAIRRGQGHQGGVLNPPLAQAPPPVSAMDFARLEQAQQPQPAPPIQTMPPVTASASPLPPAAPQQPPPTEPPPLPPSLAIPSTQAAPGMAQVPQTEQQLAEWRKLMDAMQFARQGV